MIIMYEMVIMGEMEQLMWAQRKNAQLLEVEEDTGQLSDTESGQ